MQNKMIIEVIINGKGPFYFLFDTGMSQSCISETLAQKLELQFISGQSMLINNIPHEVDFYRLNTLKIGNAEIYDYDVAVLPEPGVLTLINNSLTDTKITIEGAIGFGAFYDYLLTLDAKSNILSLKTGSLDPKASNTFTYQENNRIPIIPVSFKDDNGHEMKLDFVIDSGYDSQFFLPSAISSIPFNITSKKASRGEELTKYNMITIAKIKGTAIVGNKTLIEPIMIYNDKPYEGAEKRPFGLMGIDVLKSLKMTFDQKANLLKLE
jgi:predicted aspartyl protease